MIRLRGVAKEYTRGGDLAHLETSWISMWGRAPSRRSWGLGLGKTTLLNLIGGLDRPTRGTLEVAGVRLEQMNDAELSEWRAHTLGHRVPVVQLLPVLTALENVELPLLLTGPPRRSVVGGQRSRSKIVGSPEDGHYPRQLSGGQEQRVAIARPSSRSAGHRGDDPPAISNRQSANEVLEIFDDSTRDGKTIVYGHPRSDRRPSAVDHPPARQRGAGMTLGSLIVRNVFRNKVRFVLTVSRGAAVAVMTFVSLRTALASWTPPRSSRTRTA